MDCLSCSRANRPGRMFCAQCGSALSAACPRCQFVNDPGDAFCGGCGTSLAREPGEGAGAVPSQAPGTPALPAEIGERRQATIVFSDLSGYTAMNEALDPEEVETIVSRIKAKAVYIIEALGGTVNQFVGDEIVALYGVPVAHVDDAHRALLATMEIHRLVLEQGQALGARLEQPLALHSGANSGLIVITHRDDRDGRYGITGDAVNTAARLAAKADTNEILITERTRRLTGFTFRTESTGPLALKGKDKPVTAYRILGSGRRRAESFPRAGGFRTPYIGNEQVIGAIMRGLRRARSGNGKIVEVIGETGIGKSRLWREVRQRLPKGKVTVIEAACPSFGPPIPYAPFIDMLRRGLRLDRRIAPERIRPLVRERLLALDAGLEPHVESIRELLSASTQLDVRTETTDAGEGQTHFDSALLACVRSLARTGVVVLCVDDWQWADEASRRLVLKGKDEIAGCAVMLVLLCREASDIPAVPGPALTRIPLKALDQAQTATIMKAQLGAEILPEELVVRIHEHTAGVPFFIEELCSSLLEKGKLERSEGRIVLASPLERLDLPGSVTAVIQSRIDRLSNETRATMRLAAVMGKEFTRQILERLDASQSGIIDTLDLLCRAELIQPVTHLPDVDYTFKHIMTQSVVYDSLLIQHRRQLHGLVASAIEMLYGDRLENWYEKLAYHFQMSDNADKAIHYGRLAGDKAAALYAIDTARKHYVQAIAMIDRAPSRPEWDRIRIDLSVKLAWCNAYNPTEEMIASLERSAELAAKLADPALQATLHYWLARHTHTSGASEPAKRHARTSAALARRTGDRRAEALAMAQLGRIEMMQGEFSEAIVLLEQALPALEQEHDLRELSYSLGMLGCAHGYQGAFGPCFESLERCLAIAQEHGYRTRQTTAWVYRAWMHAIQGDWERSIGSAAEAMHLARAIENRTLASYGLAFQGYSRFMNGEREAGLAAMEEGLAGLARAGVTMSVASLHARLAELYLINGDPAQAGRALDTATALADLGEIKARTIIERVRAMAMAPEAAGGKAALHHALTAIRLAEETHQNPDLAIAALRTAELLLRTDEPAAAAPYAERARALFEQMEMSGWLDAAADAVRAARTGDRGRLLPMMRGSTGGVAVVALFGKVLLAGHYLSLYPG